MSQEWVRVVQVQEKAFLAMKEMASQLRAWQRM